MYSKKTIAIIDIPKTLEAITLVIKIVGNSKRWERYLTSWVETPNAVGIENSGDYTEYSFYLKNNSSIQATKITYIEFINKYTNNRAKEKSKF